MTESDVVWKPGKVPEGTLDTRVPGRFAFTCVFETEDSDQRILVVDPHPQGSWHQWMLPYASYVISIEDDHLGDTIDLRPESSFAHLQNAIEGLLGRRRAEYEQAVTLGVNNVVRDLQYSLASEVLGLNYSLKFSKTSNSYTAYRFEYRRATIPASPAHLPFMWLTAQEIRAAGSGTINDRPLASNVVDIVDILEAS